MKPMLISDVGWCKAMKDAFAQRGLDADALRYFQHGDFTPTEITFALGFSDPSNFYRACKRWFGRSPSTMRCAN